MTNLPPELETLGAEFMHLCRLMIDNFTSQEILSVLAAAYRTQTVQSIWTLWVATLPKSSESNGGLR